ncbi:MAG: NAD(P)H-hydrate dehydratase [Planctomycetota bacterium]
MTSFKQADEPTAPDQRRPDAHKGSFGHVLVVGGSRRMMGAALMCSAAATRSGAGLCTLACPDSMQPIVPLFTPTTMSIPLAETVAGSIALGAWPQIEAFFGRATVCAAGPGLSRNRSTRQLVHRIVRRCPLPLVLDADGLNALAGAADLVREANVPVVLTPHPGEMARLTGRSIGEVQENRRRAACRLSERVGAVVVLKGAGTVVAGEEKVYINRTGNPHMASGGTGDVLTGMVAGLLAQGLGPFDAARTAVYWHGLAADRAPNAAGPGAVTATDILDEMRSSASDLDWYGEELDLGEPDLFDPDRDDSDDDPP